MSILGSAMMVLRKGGGEGGADICRSLPRPTAILLLRLLSLTQILSHGNVKSCAIETVAALL